MRRVLPLIFASLLTACPLADAQLGALTSPPSSGATGNLFTNPTLTPEKSFLLNLDRRFSRETAEGGGAAFAKWFAPDGVLVPEGKPAVIGEAAITAHSDWTAAEYRLTWTPEGARMNHSGTAGFTWGLYKGRTQGHSEIPTVVTGRYMTVWEKQPNGDWKVALETTNHAPPPVAACSCKLP